MKMENRSHRYDTNRPRSGHEHKYSKSKKGLTIMMLTLATFKAQFMKKLCNAEAELKKPVAYKKKRVVDWIMHSFTGR